MSEASSLSISEKPSLLKTLLNRQINRYKQKGLKNCAIAFLLLFTIVYGGTKLGEYLWPQNIQNPQMFTIVSTLTIHVTCQLLYFLLFLPGYLGSKSYQKYIINKDMKKPWERQNWGTMKLRTAWYLFLNKGITFPIMVYGSMKMSGLKTRFNDFPTPIQVLVQLIIIMLIEDFFFFWAHKFTHDFPFLYKFHKIHHEYDYVFSLAAEYTHPIDYIIGVLIPSALPFIFMGDRVHCFMLFFWQIWKIYISSQGHCGFQFPWSPTRILLFVSGASYHDFHHSKNVGNFAGSVYLWDTIMGTNQTYYNNLQKLQNIQRQKNHSS